MRLNQSKKFGSSMKTSITSLPVLAASILAKLYADVDEWPIELLVDLLEDCLGSRQWVDHVDSKPFCVHILSFVNSSAVVKSDLQKSFIDTIVEKIRKRCGTGTAVSAVINTILTFCGLAEVRQLAAKNLSNWVSNAALSELIRKLLIALVDNMEYATVKADGDHSESSTLLIESDMCVILDIVNLKSHLKASQLDTYRNTLIHASRKSSKIAFYTLHCILCKEVMSGAVSQDSMKLVVVLLKALVAPSGASGSSGTGARPAAGSPRTVPEPTPQKAPSEAKPSKQSVFSFVKVDEGLDIYQLLGQVLHAIIFKNTPITNESDRLPEGVLLVNGGRCQDWDGTKTATSHVVGAGPHVASSTEEVKPTAEGSVNVDHVSTAIMGSIPHRLYKGILDLTVKLMVQFTSDDSTVTTRLSAGGSAAIPSSISFLRSVIVSREYPLQHLYIVQFAIGSKVLDHHTSATEVPVELTAKSVELLNLFGDIANILQLLHGNRLVQIEKIISGASGAATLARGGSAGSTGPAGSGLSGGHQVNPSPRPMGRGGGRGTGRGGGLVLSVNSNPPRPVAAGRGYGAGGRGYAAPSVQKTKPMPGKPSALLPSTVQPKGEATTPSTSTNGPPVAKLQDTPAIVKKTDNEKLKNYHLEVICGITVLMCECVCDSMERNLEKMDRVGGSIDKNTTTTDMLNGKDTLDHGHTYTSLGFIASKPIDNKAPTAGSEADLKQFDLWKWLLRSFCLQVSDLHKV